VPRHHSQFHGSPLEVEKRHPKKRVVLWKSDVKGAFRLIPIHPLWQLKQIIMVNVPSKEQMLTSNVSRMKRHVDHCCSFGSCGSPRCWCSFIGLVCWIAVFIKLIEDLFAYMDDHFSWDELGHLRYYRPYNRRMPDKQARLLELWDELGIPHDEGKQLSGETLMIIGFLVDLNEMTVTLPSDAKESLVEHVRDFVNTSSRRQPLQEWSELAGYICWSLNVFPLLRPALCNVYAKLSNKGFCRAEIYINKPIIDDLNWFLNHARLSSGVLVYQAIDWNTFSESDVELRCDACLDGMGFWCPELGAGFYADVPFRIRGDKIFFWEAICVLAALDWCACKYAPGLYLDRRARVSILTDNENTVHLFDSLAALPMYNDILKKSVDILLSSSVDLRVIHIPGVNNEVADTLSRKDFNRAHRMVNNLSIDTFEPPRVTLRPGKK
jgi:hypothetical protein